MLARFRADPAVVRVAWRNHDGLWLVTITTRDGHRGPVQKMARCPLRAMAMALRSAEDFGIPGIDLGMQWSYRHPQQIDIPGESNRGPSV